LDNYSPARGLLTSLLLGLSLPLLTGCQTWSAFGFGNPSRVPPPATGTYQPPVGYYNNSSPAGSTPVSSTVPGMSDGLAASRANETYQPPVQSSPDSRLGGPAVQTAAFSQAAEATPRAGPIPASASLSDTTEMEQPSLRWQQ
jgi:hypothetical protein